MTTFRAQKVVSALPATLTPDTVYAVRVGTGFDLYISDSTGLMAYQINSAGAAPDPLVLSGLTNTPTPIAGKVQVFGKEDAGRIMPAIVGPSGLDTRLQPHLGGNRVSMWQPNGAGSTLATILGGAWVATTMVAASMADTPIGRIRRGQGNTTATAGNALAVTSETAYSRNTGFHVIGHFCPFVAGAVASRRFFAGMAATAITNAALTGYAGMGVHADTTQTTLQVRGVNGVMTDLGSNFPANVATVWYRLELFCPPGGTTVGWKITNMLSNISATGTFINAQVPAAGTFMAARANLLTTAATAQSMWLGHWMVESDL